MLANLSSLILLRYFALSGSSLLVHDYFITFPSEVEYIWKAPWSATKAGFLLNRYGNLIGQTAITLQEMGAFGSSSQQLCDMFCLYFSIFTFFSGETIRFVVTRRAWAIWGCSRRVTICLIILYVLYVITVIVMALRLWGRTGAFPPLDGACWAMVSEYSWLMWFATLVVDSIVLITVCNSLRKSFMGLGSISTSPLVRLLLRDAVLFYAATLFSNGFSIICWTTFRQDPRVYLQLVFSLPVLTVTGQRLVLNLRGLRARRYTSSDVSRVVDQDLGALDDEWWHPTDGSSPRPGTTDAALELTELPAR